MTDTPKPLTADEIAERKRMIAELGGNRFEGRYIATIEQQREQIEKLRKALEQIAKAGENGLPPDYTSWLQFHERVAQMSCKALTATEPPK